MSLEDMSPELQEKVKACKSKEELAELAKAMGVQLSEDELSAVAGTTSSFRISTIPFKDVCCNLFLQCDLACWETAPSSGKCQCWFT
jgi:hypothetical protein